MNYLRISKGGLVKGSNHIIKRTEYAAVVHEKQNLKLRVVTQVRVAAAYHYR